VALVASQRVRSEDILLIKIEDYTLLISHEAFLQSWAKQMRLRGVFLSFDDAHYNVCHNTIMTVQIYAINLTFSQAHLN